VADAERKTEWKLDLLAKRTEELNGEQDQLIGTTVILVALSQPNETDLFRV
jgi:hypothetical protein